MNLKGGGPRNFQVCYGLLEQPQGDPLENPPFSMTYGLEVVIPTEVRMQSLEQTILNRRAMT